MAAAKGQEAMVWFLVDCGVDDDAKEESGFTVLHWARIQGDITMALVDCGAKVNTNGQ
jgi:hypothetical protein